ncbi:MAG TPA: tetratricopeptide repeat protein [Bryocella sp.]|nr:tetratricopeptide repeat protein [Bryocella sp.]
MHTRSLSWLAIPLAGLCLVLPAAPQTLSSSQPAATSTVEPAMQLPPDRKAYKAAHDIADRDQRIAAFRAFLHDFPDSKLDEPARDMLLKLLLAVPPQDTQQVHEVANALVDHATAEGRANEENTVAYELAEAPPNGVDLQAAEGWAKDAVDKSTIPALVAQLKETMVKFKVALPTPEEMQKSVGPARAADLQTLADVYFREGKLRKASKALDEAHSLKPDEGDVYLTMGQIAHARHKDTEALEDLELSNVYGGMTPSGQSLLLDLYRAKHHGDAAGLEDELDTRYRALQHPFTPPPHTAPAARRSVFVELYTGSACEPCVAADLGLDGLLQAYPRSEVVALSFDEHIPAPDPLANADTEGRADYLHLGGTPTVWIDGLRANGIGGGRSQAKSDFDLLTRRIDADLGTPSGITLQLSANLTPEKSIAASAEVRVTDPTALTKALTAEPLPNPSAPNPSGSKPSASGAAPSAPAKPETAAKPSAAPQPPHLVLNFALVQKDVRYSGENGIRFHSMVVRALARPTTEAFPVAASGSSTAAFSFDPASLSASLSKYLDDYQQYSTRFGPVHFLMTDTTLPLGQLAVAAWVEDLNSHHVLAAAFAPLESHAQKAAR